MKIKSLINVILYFTCQIFISVIVVIFSASKNSVSIDDAFSNSNVMMDLLFYTGLITLIILLIVNFKELKSDFFEKFLVGGGIYKSLIWIMLLPLYFIITAIISSIIAAPEDTSSLNQQILETIFANGNRLLFFCSVTIFAPFNEEIVFRYSMSSFFKTRNAITTILRYALMILPFALIHFDFGVDAFSALVPYLVLSTFLAMTYRWSRTIFASIWVHSVVNTLAFIAMSFVL